MQQIEVKPLKDSDVHGAARVLAEAFRTNPALVRGMGGTGDKEVAKAEKLYRLSLGKMPGESFTAWDGEDLVGAMRIVHSSRCQPRPLESLRMMPSMAWILRTSLLPAIRWFAAWGKEDPKEPHIHLGPIGVLPGRQGGGIGTRMMERYLELLDSKSIAGYLETDKDINVTFYERFGFKTTKELNVLGVPTWLMWRDATECETSRQ